MKVLSKLAVISAAFFMIAVLAGCSPAAASSEETADIPVDKVTLSDGTWLVTTSSYIDRTLLQTGRLEFRLFEDQVTVKEASYTMPDINVTESSMTIAELTLKTYEDVVNPQDILSSVGDGYNAFNGKEKVTYYSNEDLDLFRVVVTTKKTVEGSELNYTYEINYKKKF